MSAYEQATSKEEYLEILENVILDSKGSLLKCPKCGELLINLIHGKHHDVLMHGANWEEIRR